MALLVAPFLGPRQGLLTYVQDKMRGTWSRAGQPPHTGRSWDSSKSQEVPSAGGVKELLFVGKKKGSMENNLTG